MSHPAERAGAVLLAHAPMDAVTVRGLLLRQSWVRGPLARNPQLGEAAWRELYAPGLPVEVAARLVDRPLSPAQARFALVDRQERRAWPVELLLRHGQCPLPAELLVPLLDGPGRVRAALAVVDWVPEPIRRRAAASVPAARLRPVEPAALRRLSAEFTGKVTITDEERAHVAASPTAAIALFPWRLQRAAAELAGRACGADVDAWDTLLRLLPTFRGELRTLLTVAPALAA